MKKKKLFAALVMSIMVLNTQFIPGVSQITTVEAAISGAVQNIPIYVNGKQITLTDSTGRPILTDNRTLVPMRVVSENLGAKVDWDNNKKSFVITSADGKTVITGYANKSVVKVNGVEKQIDESPNVVVKQLNSRLYVPIRFFAENMGCSVDYKNRTVYITTAGNTPIIPPTTGKLDKNYTDFNNAEKAIEYVADTLPEWDFYNGSDTSATSKNSLIILATDRGTSDDVIAKITIREWNRKGDEKVDEDVVRAQNTMAQTKELLQFYLGDSEGSEAYNAVNSCINKGSGFTGKAQNGMTVKLTANSAGYVIQITK